MKFKNINPNGAVDVPELGLVNVAAGDVIEASGDVGESMLRQSTWEHIPDPKRVRAGKKAAATRETEGEGSGGD